MLRTRLMAGVSALILLAGLGAAPGVAAAEGDTTPPTITYTKGSAPNAKGWYTSDVTVTFTCADESGIISSCTPPVTLSADGANQSVTGTAVDGAGNTASITVSGINIDKTPPQSWYLIHNGYIHINAMDNASGIFATYYQADGGFVSVSKPPYVLPFPSGSHYFELWSVDGAGNVEPHQVVVEGAGPVITVTHTPLPNEAGWNSSDVTLSFDCVDNESGVALCPAPVTVSTEGAHQTVTVTAWDNAGNPNTATVSDINIDLSAPTVTFSGNVGAYTVDQSVVINCSASDALSGLQSTTCANLNTPAYMLPLGMNTVSAEATDRVGHLTTANTTFAVNVTYDAMCNLTQRFATTKNVANNLCKLLRNAASAEAKGDLSKKQQNIQSYIDGVNAQVGKAFTTDQAAVLTRLAQAL